jgi:MYXO-CTERM domain-containing protein
MVLTRLSEGQHATARYSYRLPGAVEAKQSATGAMGLAGVALIAWHSRRRSAPLFSPPRAEGATDYPLYKCAPQHLLKPIHLERLHECRSVAIGLRHLAIARRKEERRAAGN